jgi:adenosylcobinamide kinase/adenosylcobinamide-phosphate guanylyltransferase
MGMHWILPVPKRQTTILLYNNIDVTMNLKNLLPQYNPPSHFEQTVTMKQLILGGARSGKSLLAERRAAASGQRVVYLATAEARDGEMLHRIAHHRARRPLEWECVEETLHLADRLHQLATPDTCLLVDCLTLWLSNLLFAGRAAAQAEAGETIDCPLFAAETSALLETLPRLPGQIILVSNEVGWGIVPMHPVSRLFADEQGRLNQRVATVCDQVTLVAAGLPLELKSPAAGA